MQFDKSTTTIPDTILECGHKPTPRPPESFSTGYAVDAQGKRYCYACCAVRDREQMQRDGKATLYLVKRDAQWFVTNWPSSLEFRALNVRTVKGAGGFGSDRTDADFIGPDGAVWHAVNRGDNQIARCKRTKRKNL